MQLGELIVTGFPSTSPPPQLLRALEKGDLGGVIFFERNLSNVEELCACIRDLQTRAKYPLLLMTDHEGGRVQRFKSPFTLLPSLKKIGDTNDPLLAKKVACIGAAELSHIGINLNLSPVVDVLFNPQNQVIGDRALGGDLKRVATLVPFLIQGIQEESIAACAKHFPGHGFTSFDSHTVLPVDDRTLEQLKETEIPSFMAAIQANVAVMMTAHILYPNVDPEFPATLSRRILTDLLRKECRFEGVIITDALEMKAISSQWNYYKAATLALQAGADLLLFAEDFEDAISVSRKLALAPKLSQSHLTSSLRRVRKLKAHFPTHLPRMEAIGLRRHVSLLSSFFAQN